MGRRSVREALSLGFGIGLWLAVCAGGARAQGVAGMSGVGFTANPSPSTLQNPYLNPYMNPYFNPYMTQAAQTPGQAALYFYAAQQMTGGLGSGRLSGVRPAPGDASARKTTAHASTATKETPHGSNTPGAGASRYFNRSFAAVPTPSHYYNRQSRQLPTNGR
jgi:hypothetical protein